MMLLQREACQVERNQRLASEGIEGNKVTGRAQPSLAWAVQNRSRSRCSVLQRSFTAQAGAVGILCQSSGRILRDGVLMLEVMCPA